MAPKLRTHEANPAGGEAPRIEPASSAERPGAPRVSRQRADRSSEPSNLAPDTGADQKGDGEDPDDIAPDGDFIYVAGEIVDDPKAVSRLALQKPERKTDTSLARVDPFQAYMREVQQHPLLSPEEEHALAVHYAETGDVATAARLVTANLRLVVKLAYEYRRAYRNMMDLIQEGNIGLMQAVKRYDPYRGVKLSSYAA